MRACYNRAGKFARIILGSIIGIATMELHLPGVDSLKGKRRILKSLLTRLRQSGNYAAAEIAEQERWQSATIAIVTISTSRAHVQRQLASAERWLERNYPQVNIIHTRHELL